MHFCKGWNSPPVASAPFGSCNSATGRQERAGNDCRAAGHRPERERRRPAPPATGPLRGADGLYAVSTRRRNGATVSQLRACAVQGLQAGLGSPAAVCGSPVRNLLSSFVNTFPWGSRRGYATGLECATIEWLSGFSSVSRPRNLGAPLEPGSDRKDDSLSRRSPRGNAAAADLT